MTLEPHDNNTFSQIFNMKYDIYHGDITNSHTTMATDIKNNYYIIAHLSNPVKQMHSKK